MRRDALEAAANVAAGLVINAGVLAAIGLPAATIGGLAAGMTGLALARCFAIRRLFRALEPVAPAEQTALDL